ncbi:hypothetical protein NHX12_005928 [Muraenolepis orangiensis]|uniref:C-type lectin domain-containing protein n=1 Tax=Muraenolepis orangiensis TaxID=630683 RepID=A0A9Q0DS93_9TELE|nr:hypothetical protein NHX12_005928 [Muraenolepis orangiensis]
MDTDLRCVFILVLFGLSLLLVSSDLRQGNYVHMGSPQHSWTDAMENCKDVFNSSLLIIENEAQDSELEYKEGWIALRLMDNSQWQWPGGRPLNYSRLTDHTDVNKKCVKRKNSEWKGEDCGHDKPFFCANNKLLLIKENKTWEQALEHCRGLLGINNTKKVVGYHLSQLSASTSNVSKVEMSPAVSPTMSPAAPAVKPPGLMCLPVLSHHPQESAGKIDHGIALLESLMAQGQQLTKPHAIAKDTSPPEDTTGEKPPDEGRVQSDNEVQSPEDVVHRYCAVFKESRRTRINVDRNTIALMAIVAEGEYCQCSA